jgi:phosphotransferase system HPr-like phosphotransfer protein
MLGLAGLLTSLEVKRGACVEHEYATNEELEAMEQFKALVEDKFGEEVMGV